MKARWLGLAQTAALLAVLALFFARYHVVLPSDDLFAVQALRKERLGFTDTIVVVPDWVERYNAAGPERRAALDDSYVMRRLRETGMVVER